MRANSRSAIIASSSSLSSTKITKISSSTSTTSISTSISTSITLVLLSIIRSWYNIIVGIMLGSIIVANTSRRYRITTNSFLFNNVHGNSNFGRRQQQQSIKCNYYSTSTPNYDTSNNHNKNSCHSSVLPSHRFSFGKKQQHHCQQKYYISYHAKQSSSSSSSRLLSTATATAAENGTTTTATATTTVSESELASTVLSDNNVNNNNNNNNGVVVQVLGNEKDFIKPDRDPRQYRVIRLPNNLQVLLVSDQMTTGIGIEAASVHVQAGHFDDTIPGLAHFHEHMLFLGTKKYPDEDDYQIFLNQNGGRSNAYTDMEDTNYYFSITTDASTCQKQPSNALYGSLDRLAQFFIQPTFHRDAVDREINAIDSEYKNGKTNDLWRNYQLLKSLCNKRHPFSKFGCGNYDTLTSSGGIDGLLKELHKFWQDYYRTYNLRLTVVGHSPLDVLQQVVVDTFGQLPYSTGVPRRIRNNNNQVFPRENAVYGGYNAFSKDGGQVGKVRHVIPLKESRTIQLFFPIPPLHDPVLQSSKPYAVISHLLGHEGPGSLHALLNDKGYINSLASGTAITTADFALFQISVSVTRDGIANTQEILDLLFQWIGLIQQLDEEQMLLHHTELQQLSNVNFKFYENGNPVDFCSAASKILFDETLINEPTKLLTTSFLGDFNWTVSRLFLQRFVPDNTMITITNSDYNTTTTTTTINDNGTDNDVSTEWKTEPLYGAVYKEEVICPEQMKVWADPKQKIHERLHIPALNKYIPTDFSLRCDDDNDNSNAVADMKNVASSSKSVSAVALPQLIRETHNLRLWHKMDSFWRVPKTHIKASFLSPSVYSSPRNMTYNRIYQRMLNDDLNSFVYDAALAGCSFSVSCTTNGYRISVFGYSEKLQSLLDTVTGRMLSLLADMRNNDQVLLEKFNKAKEALLRETKNNRFEPPYKTAMYNSRLLIEDGVWYIDDYINLMEGTEAVRNPLTMIECADAVQESLTGNTKCELLCMGNINTVQCNDAAAIIYDRFLQDSKYLSEAEIRRFRSNILPTIDEAVAIFGPEVASRTIPIIYQELANSESEENNAIEVVLQVGSELQLGYEGVAMLNLIAHIAYNSAFGQLRTKEQLGYIVSARAKKNAGGVWGISIIVQSSVQTPEILQERCEAWLDDVFRIELANMTNDSITKEASAVVAQLLKSDTKLSREVSRVWGEIVSTEGLVDRLRAPVFDRVQKVAQELTVIDDDGTTTTTTTDEISSTIQGKKTADELKQCLLNYFDTYLRANSKQRRAVCSRVYSHTAKQQYEALVDQPGILSSYSDIQHFKQFLGTYPTIPYWAAGSR